MQCTHGSVPCVWYRYVVDKKGQTTTYSTFEDGKYVDTPLIVLVDSKTASASEIFSSAMQVGSPSLHRRRHET